MNFNIYFLSYLVHLFFEREMFGEKVVEKIETQILCSVTLYIYIYTHTHTHTRTHTHTHTHTHIYIYIYIENRAV